MVCVGVHLLLFIVAYGVAIFSDQCILISGGGGL